MLYRLLFILFKEHSFPFSCYGKVSNLINNNYEQIYDRLI